MIRQTALFIALASTLVSGAAIAEDHPQGGNDHYVKHSDWKKGGHIASSDWGRGQQVDYRQHHLNAPPKGYEWREVDGNYVLAAAATGVIASVIVASAAH